MAHDITRARLPFGVIRIKKRFVARVLHRGQPHHLGTFDTIEEAAAVALEFRAKNPRQTLRERFEKFLRRDEATGCLIFTGSLNIKGYGQFRVAPGNSGMELAHRVAWQLENGEIPADNPQILHNCPGGDRAACCEPTHLRCGTDADNMRDKAIKHQGRKSLDGLPYGVSMDRRRKSVRYQAGVKVNGKSTHFGTFDTWQEAAAIAAYHKNRLLYPELHG